MGNDNPAEWSPTRTVSVPESISEKLDLGNSSGRKEAKRIIRKGCCIAEMKQPFSFVDFTADMHKNGRRIMRGAANSNGQETFKALGRGCYYLIK